MEFIEIIKAIILGIIEGITEWLPVSSTGHMILVDEFLQLNMSPAFKEMFFVVIQLGAIMAVVVLYWKKIFPFSFKKKPFVQNGKEIKIVFMICLKKDQVEMYKVITKKLYRLMQKSNYVEMLTKVDSFEEMMSLMKEIGGGNNE